MVIEDIRRNLPLVGYQAVGKVVRELSDYVDKKTETAGKSFFKRYSSYIKLGVGVGGLILPSLVRGASPEMRFAGAIVGSNILAEVIVDSILETTGLLKGEGAGLTLSTTTPTVIKIPEKRPELEVA